MHVAVVAVRVVGRMIVTMMMIVAVTPTMMMTSIGNARLDQR